MYQVKVKHTEFPCVVSNWRWRNCTQDERREWREIEIYLIDEINLNLYFKIVQLVIQI